jgi:hypothetical protein
LQVSRLGCAKDHLNQSLHLAAAVGADLRDKLDAAMERELRSLDRELDLRTCNLVSDEELEHTRQALARYLATTPSGLWAKVTARGRRAPSAAASGG